MKKITKNKIKWFFISTVLATLISLPLTIIIRAMLSHNWLELFFSLFVICLVFFLPGSIRMAQEKTKKEETEEELRRIIGEGKKEYNNGEGKVPCPNCGLYCLTDYMSPNHLQAFYDNKWSEVECPDCKSVIELRVLPKLILKGKDVYE